MKFLGPPSSGSAQGTTWSRNRFGQYTRSRATPVNPASPPQVLQRARMANNAAGWRAITDIQRAGWEALGAQIERTDSLGQTYNFNGFMCYCSVNNNNLDAGDAVVSAAPALTTPGTLETATITLTVAAMSIAYTVDPLAASTRLFSFVSPQVSAGRTFNGDSRLIAVSAEAAASPADIFSAYEARLGTPVVGNRIFFDLVLFKNGFKGARFTVSQLVV